MKTLKLKLVGTNPMLMHNGQMANPLNAQVIYMKQFTKKRGKTEQDLRELARMEWEAGLYLHEGKVVIPADNIHRCLTEGARATKHGKQFEAGVRVAQRFTPLNYDGVQVNSTKEDFPNPDFDEAYKEHSDIQMVTVGTAKTPRCRPIFNSWSCEVELNYNDTIINESEIIGAANDAGMLKGLGDRRPMYGSFEVEKINK